MKKSFLALLVLLLLPLYLFSAETLEYKVTAYGLSFARVTMTKMQNNGILYHYVHVKNGFPASLLRSVDNRYLTQLDAESLFPLKQEKYLGGVSGEYHLNLFTPGQPEFIGDGKLHPAPDTPLHTLFSLMETIERTRPDKTARFSAVSCNTVWTVTVTPLSRASYRLTFSSDAPVARLKERYDDIFLKEIFWNSGQADLFFDSLGHLEKAVLNSFSPPVTLSLTRWSQTLNKP